jgi:actin related protein 2/3 complex, subunit 5
VEKVLITVTEKEISGLVDALDQESLDNLMKYVFRFMSKSLNCSLMLKLHESITEKSGLGCIVRVMTDRKQV